MRGRARLTRGPHGIAEVPSPVLSTNRLISCQNADRFRESVPRGSSRGPGAGGRRRERRGQLPKAHACRGLRRGALTCGVLLCLGQTTDT